MDYNRLKCFVEVARAGSVTAASQKLYRTQSAISQQICKLELELKTALFERVGKKMLLTPQGQIIYETAQNKLQELDHEIAWVLSKGTELEGHIRVGLLYDSATSFHFFDRLSAFCRQYPNISCEVTLGTSKAIERLMLENKIEIGVLINFTERSLFEVFEVARANHVLVSSKQYIKEHGPFTTIDAILNAHLIDLDDAFTCLRVWVHKNFPKMLPRLFQKKPAISAANHTAIYEVVSNGFGIAISPEYILDNKVVKLMPQYKSLTVGLDIAYRKSLHLHMHHKLFLDFFR